MVDNCSDSPETDFFEDLISGNEVKRFALTLKRSFVRLVQRLSKAVRQLPYVRFSDNAQMISTYSLEIQSSPGKLRPAQIGFERMKQWA